MKYKKLIVIPVALCLCAATIKIKQLGQPDAYVPTMDADNTTTLTVNKIKAKNFVDNNSGTPLLPPGILMPFAGSVAPSGWLLAYGQEVSQATYAGLYAAIGSTYCTTDHGGTCTGGNFRIPDLRGRSIFGKDNMGGTAVSRITAAKTVDGTVLGKGNGNDKQTDTPVGTNAASNVPANYTFNGTASTHSVTVPAHYHGLGTINISKGTTSIGLSVSSCSASVSGTTSTDGNHGHTYRTPDEGASVDFGSHYVVGGFGTRSTGAAGNHTHTVSSSGSCSVSASTNISHTHPVGEFGGAIGATGSGNNGDGSLTASGSNTPAGTISGTATAAAQAFTGTEGNNLPPMTILNYIIKI